MKNILNFSKLAIATLTLSSMFVACSDEISENSYSTPYTSNASNIKNVGKPVDLGLPSKTLWADINLGASSETDNGILFVWSDITGTQMLPTSTTYSTNPTSEEDLFKMFKGTEAIGHVYDTTEVHKLPLSEILVKDTVNTIMDSLKTVYKDQGEIAITNGEESIVYNLIKSKEFTYYKSKQGDYKDETGADITGAPIYNLISNAKYDPATANWGSQWSMPSPDQIKELIENCTWEFIGSGYRVTGPNGKHIFMPAAGYRYGDQQVGLGNAGYYATGQIQGTYHFPSMLDQYKKQFGSVTSDNGTPTMLIFQHGKFDNSVKVYNNLTTQVAFSIRPVTK